MTDGFKTRSLHAGQDPDETTGARAPPLHQTTSYVFEDAETAADLYALAPDADGDVYSRISNPTVRTLEDRLAALEGGVAAVATASGMAALDAATSVLARAGNNIVVAADMYGGTATYFRQMATRRGITIRTVDTLAYDEYTEEIDSETAFVHVETIANPSLKTPDIERIADIAHNAETPLVVDNTFATPALSRPIEYGADIIWESTTKWLHGSGTTVGGILVDGGTFPWEHADYDELSGENPTFGIDFVDRYGAAAFAHVARQRALRTLGNQQSPFDAWQTLQGLETLPLRMERHCANAKTVAIFLRNHNDVAWVSYPGFEDHPTHDKATQYLGTDIVESGYGGMLTFGLEGGFEVAKRTCEETSVISFLANVGDAKTLIIHPASTTHAQLSAEEQQAAGLTPDMLRLSVGLEDPDDIIDDLNQAIHSATMQSEDYTRREGTHTNLAHTTDKRTDSDSNTRQTDTEVASSE
ncbi:O-acetylhomoserine aminocarboxypropyltransferase/cysteine synthase family protein [Haloquadratum walsbyi]|jgi:O-acetylhomoserine (thiol)-lyase|uniref:O-acetylhomoserine aminocarboxypropyltransferase (Methionine synthase) n=1 Tax=Haloquadratum walsbyi (strain DSM 16854 / JCM 12705 / C23) TaxID=768065 RepID=G0LFS4_HALWC|nr:O-acetylhomoserine aminocarboxypropyltransferase/cysteine synthase family protein [Haloquadratum walsbyi]CCC41837.1 O-acetylhomoserine aminocarboxypropyltransferase (methionine synthase) [Haloquadratum walsbyi C23]